MSMSKVAPWSDGDHNSVFPHYVRNTYAKFYLFQWMVKEIQPDKMAADIRSNDWSKNNTSTAMAMGQNLSNAWIFFFSHQKTFKQILGLFGMVEVCTPRELFTGGIQDPLNKISTFSKEKYVAPNIWALTLTFTLVLEWFQFLFAGRHYRSGFPH